MGVVKAIVCRGICENISPKVYRLAYPGTPDLPAVEHLLLELHTIILCGIHVRAGMEPQVRRYRVCKLVEPAIELQHRLHETLGHIMCVLWVRQVR